MCSSGYLVDQGPSAPSRLARYQLADSIARGSCARRKVHRRLCSSQVCDLVLCHRSKWGAATKWFHTEVRRISQPSMPLVSWLSLSSSTRRIQRLQMTASSKVEWMSGREARTRGGSGWLSFQIPSHRYMTVSRCNILEMSSRNKDGNYEQSKYSQMLELSGHDISPSANAQCIKNLQEQYRLVLLSVSEPHHSLAGQLFRGTHRRAIFAAIRTLCR